MLTDTRARAVRIEADAALAAVLAAGLVALAFVTAGGDQLGPDTWAEIVLVAIAAGLVAWLLLAGGRGPWWGGTAVALFAAITALTACSIAWSVTPDQSWIEAGRTLSYFAAFAGAALLARMLPGRWRAIVGALALTATALAVWAVLVKVFTWSPDQQIQFGRLLTPFGYWNATGLMAALGLPPLLWEAGRPRRSAIARGLSAAAIALLLTVVVLSYSRSAVAAAILGSAIVLACGRTRLRCVQMLALGGAAAAAICAWAIGDRGLTANLVTESLGGVSLAARQSADGSFGIVLLIALALTVAIGAAAAAVTERRPLPESRRRAIGTVLISAFALVPVAAVIALFASARGFTGEISHIWATLTSPSGAAPTPSRLLDLSNSRPGYWRQGFSVGAHHLLAGAGAGSFGVAHLRYGTASLTGAQQVSHAHSYVIETFADFGLIGVGLNLALLIGWALAARRTIGRPAREHGPERDAMVALLGVVVAFGVSSAIDWTWFYPGVAVPALVAAGWLAGRGAPDRAVGLRATVAHRLVLSGRAVLGATAIGIATLALAYLVWQPLHSADADGAAIAAESGHLAAALTDARSAVDDFPVSLQAMEILSELEHAAREPAAAEAELLHATSVQPDNPYAWEALGQYELERGDFARALSDLRRASRLDVTRFTDPGLGAQIAEAAAKAR